MNTPIPTTADLVIPGSVVGGVGLLFLVVKYALRGYRQAQEEFMPRLECVQRHASDGTHYAGELERHRESTTAVRDGLAAVVVKVERLQLQAERADERQKWIVAALGSLMQKAGANGVPPPPED